MEKENHFDKVAGEWDANIARNELTAAVAENIRKKCCLRGDSLLLEYGCGTGTLSLLLARDAAEITAMDSSQGMIAEVKKKIAQAKYSNIFPMQLDLSGEVDFDRKFDLIFSSMTLHHVVEQHPLLKKLVSMLTEKGQIFIADLCPEDGSFHGDTEVPHHGCDPGKLGALFLSLGMNSYTWEVVHQIHKNDREYDIFGLYVK